VNVGKRAVEDTQRVSDTVRKEVVDVDATGEVQVSRDADRAALTAASSFDSRRERSVTHTNAIVTHLVGGASPNNPRIVDHLVDRHPVRATRGGTGDRLNLVMPDGARSRLPLVVHWCTALTHVVQEWRSRLPQDLPPSRGQCRLHDLTVVDEGMATPEVERDLKLWLGPQLRSPRLQWAKLPDEAVASSRLALDRNALP
jgi:hypothetical protein